MKFAIRGGLFAASVVIWSIPARAQGFYWSLAYEPAAPVGSVRNATQNLSASGASLGARYLFEKYGSLGIGGHWVEFAQNYAPATYQIADGAITGAAFRRVWVASLLAEAHAYLAPNDPINPYLGFGAGMSWMRNEVLVTDLSIGDVVHGFTVSPEAGVLIAFDRDMFTPEHTAMQSIIAGLRYTYSTAGSRDVSSTSFVGLTMGLLIY